LFPLIYAISQLILKCVLCFIEFCCIRTFIYVFFSQWSHFEGLLIFIKPPWKKVSREKNKIVAYNCKAGAPENKTSLQFTACIFAAYLQGVQGPNSQIKIFEGKKESPIIQANNVPVIK